MSEEIITIYACHVVFEKFISIVSVNHSVNHFLIFLTVCNRNDHIKIFGYFKGLMFSLYLWKLKRIREGEIVMASM